MKIGVIRFDEADTEDLGEIFKDPANAESASKQIGDIISEIEPEGENNVFVLAFRIIEADSKSVSLRKDILEDVMNRHEPDMVNKRIHVLHEFRKINQLLEKLHADLQEKED